MRTLATIIAEQLGTNGLAWHIHRTTIGTYNKNTRSFERVF
jgi:tRNA U55 pseudouridine synthase TruB